MSLGGDLVITALVAVEPLNEKVELFFLNGPATSCALQQRWMEKGRNVHDMNRKCEYLRHENMEYIMGACVTKIRIFISRNYVPIRMCDLSAFTLNVSALTSGKEVDLKLNSIDLTFYAPSAVKRKMDVQ